MMNATDITNLIEQYDSRNQGLIGTFELFGPTVSTKEMTIAGDKEKEVRFIATYRKELWVWNAQDGLHQDVIGLPQVCHGENVGSLKSENKIILGIAHKKGSKWMMFNSDSIYKKERFKGINFAMLINNFTWLDKYISVTNWLKDDKNRTFR